jgi:NAD(P)-dependent dehydrogenase (short-subunit alcohol dehydrogenase family)
MSRVAIVTGAASGMGEAISGHLARAGHAVAVFDIDEEKAARVAEDLGATGARAVADEVAATCAFLCSDGAGYITGQVIGVNGGSVL